MERVMSTHPTTLSWTHARRSGRGDRRGPPFSRRARTQHRPLKSSTTTRIESSVCLAPRRVGWWCTKARDKNALFIVHSTGCCGRYICRPQLGVVYTHERYVQSFFCCSPPPHTATTCHANTYCILRGRRGLPRKEKTPLIRPPDSFHDSRTQCGDGLRALSRKPAPPRATPYTHTFALLHSYANTLSNARRKSPTLPAP